MVFRTSDVLLTLFKKQGLALPVSMVLWPDSSFFSPRHSLVAVSSPGDERASWNFEIFLSFLSFDGVHQLLLFSHVPMQDFSCFTGIRSVGCTLNAFSFDLSSRF